MYRLIILLALTGCATSAESVKALAEAQAKIASQPTVTIECAQGCKASYTDPRDRQNIRMPTNGWDAITSIGGSVERVVTGAVLPAAAVAAIREVRKAGDGGNSSSVTTNSSTINTSTSTTNNASGDGASTGGNAAFHTEQIGPDSQNTTQTDSHDATSTPTVVNQPAPVVVRPEVVNPIIWQPIP